MSEQQEKKNKRIALFTSIGIHALLLIAFFLMMAWRAPNPPLPEYGIELNFGMDQTGGGEIQPETSPGTPDQDNAPQEEEKVESTQPKEQVKEEVVTEKAVEPVVSKIESPVVVKEEKKEQPKEVVKEKVVETKPKVTPKEEVKKEDKKEVTVTEEKGTDAKNGDPTTSEGNDSEKGNKGDPTGINQSTVYSGNQGGGANGKDGLGLSMGGWAWASEPRKIVIPDNDPGIIEFEIECDQDGEITGIRTLQRGLSPQAEQIIRAEIMRNSLIRTSGDKAPERSKGRVVFILKTK